MVLWLRGSPPRVLWFRAMPSSMCQDADVAHVILMLRNRMHFATTLPPPNLSSILDPITGTNNKIAQEQCRLNTLLHTNNLHTPTYIYIYICIHTLASIHPSLPPSINPSIHPSIHPSIPHVYTYIHTYSLAIPIYLYLYLHLYL